jgi:lipid-A-disaccharide synthase
MTRSDDIFPGKKKHIMVLSGEPSGDQHAAGLVKEIRQIDPDLTFSGIGGSMMQKEGVDLFFHIDRLSAMGIEVLFQIRHIKDAFYQFKKHLKLDRPDMIVLVDYPGFNLRAVQWAKANYKSIKVLYYITPKVWAWNRSRIKKIKKVVDHAALILPFEEKLYKKYNIPSTYVGNPLIDSYPEKAASFPMVPSTPDQEKPKKKIMIGLLPGSRRGEIKNLLNIMLESARAIHGENSGVCFLVSCASSIDPSAIESAVKRYNQDGIFKIVKGRPQMIFEESDMIISASGTVTLEAALCCVPTVIIYRMSPISAFLARAVIRVKYAGLANLIANTELMPELLQEDATPEKISKATFLMLKELKRYKQKLQIVRKFLGKGGAALKVAKIAIALLKT